MPPCSANSICIPSSLNVALISAGVEMTDLTGRHEKDESADLSCDRSLQIQSQHQQSLPSFWLSVASEYPLLSHEATTILLPFVTAYLCETLATMRTMYKSRLNCRWKRLAFVWLFVQNSATNWAFVQSRARALPSHWHSALTQGHDPRLKAETRNNI